MANAHLITDDGKYAFHDPKGSTSAYTSKGRYIIAFIGSEFTATLDLDQTEALDLLKQLKLASTFQSELHFPA